MSKNVQVKESQTHGRGVFAARNFKKDEFILYIEGEVVETDDPSTFPPDVQNHWFPINKQGQKVKYVLPELPWKYMNHSSCDPNVGIKNNRDIVAMKPIKAGEEIVMDYSTTNIDNWEMECSCGSEKCRGKIVAFDKLDPSIKKKYLPYTIDCLKE